MRLMNKRILGVTLLEVMLVLAVAAMVIVMSIRYYQSAQTSQQANQGMALIQAITSAADNIAVGEGNYTNVTTTAVSTLVGTSLNSPTGGSATIPSATATTYTVSIPMSEASCGAVKARLSAIPKINSATPAPACASDGTLSYTYDASK